MSDKKITSVVRIDIAEAGEDLEYRIKQECKIRQDVDMSLAAMTEVGGHLILVFQTDS